MAKWIAWVLIAAGFCMPATIPAAQETKPAEQTSSEQSTNQADDLVAALCLEGLMQVISDEAIDVGDETARTMFPDEAASGWQGEIARINRPERLLALFHDALMRALAQEDPALIDAALRYFDSDFGRKVVALELSARRAMLDKDVESSAYAAYSAAAGRNDRRVGVIADMIAAADLLESNVAGALNGVLAFSRGFEVAGGYGEPMTESELIADVWAQEPQLRAETEGWLNAYLMLAYGPLTDAELRDYIAFSTRPEGKALSRALFSAFDEMFAITAYETGLRAAGKIMGQEL